MEKNVFFSSTPVNLISGVRILSPIFDPVDQYDIHIANEKVQNICPHQPISDALNSSALDARNHLIAPSLCHPHIHLDKCFLLSDPKYADLKIVNGDFAEAMELTAKAKQRFENDDLLRRGQWLIGESIAVGVTHMRAFVEVDHVVDFKCLEAALQLKRLFAAACEIQLCVFAQEPLFSGDKAVDNRKLMEQAIKREGVDAIGSTPYVEDGLEYMQSNIEWAVSTAMANNKHLDLHLDYDLDPAQPPLTTFAIETLHRCRWIENGPKTIAFGHCTRLTRCSSHEWQQIAQDIERLPIHFIGLPTSDLFIQGKPLEESGGGERPRATLQIPQLIKQYHIPGCISVNNIGNAFTPYGTCDPMHIASMGVGLYHAGTKEDAKTLYECVSTRAREAIGYPSNSIKGEDMPADFVLFDMGGAEEGPLSKRREWRTVQDIVYDPPKERKTIHKGRLSTA